MPINGLANSPQFQDDSFTKPRTVSAVTWNDDIRGRSHQHQNQNLASVRQPEVKTLRRRFFLNPEIPRAYNIIPIFWNSFRRIRKA